LLLPQKLEVFWAAGPFTPRKERVVTHHELWYRYVPESGNWHDGTFTRKIEAFSAATCTRWLGPDLSPRSALALLGLPSALPAKMQWGLSGLFELTGSLGVCVTIALAYGSTSAS
jgi:hypothetical protein